MNACMRMHAHTCVRVHVRAGARESTACISRSIDEALSSGEIKNCANLCGMCCVVPCAMACGRATVQPCGHSCVCACVRVRAGWRGGCS